MPDKPNSNPISPTPNPNPGSKPFPSPKPDLPHSDPQKKSSGADQRTQHAADRAAHKGAETEQEFDKNMQEFSR